jgi:hypothetical protein
VHSDHRLGVRLIAEESVQRKRPKLWPDMWIHQHDNPPLHDALRVHNFLAKKSIIKIGHSLYSSDLAFCDLDFSKIECPKGTNICWHSWHPTQRDVTERYFRRGFSLPFLAVVPLSHKVHSFTKRVFQRRRQPNAFTYSTSVQKNWKWIIHTLIYITPHSI